MCILYNHVSRAPLSTLFVLAPREFLKARLLERGKTSGRADDNIESPISESQRP